MRAVILAGGLGSRLSEETCIKPKPMVEIGGNPILWHIMKIYGAHGIKDFIICLGYKGNIIKQYFAHYFIRNSDVTFDLQCNSMTVHKNYSEPWKVTLVETGENSMTGGRLKRVRDYLDDEDFCFTYGDGVGNININAVIELHKKNKKLATVTAVKPHGRFGALVIEKNIVQRFEEKPKGDGSWVNGGFFVLSPNVIDYIADDNTVWEQGPMQQLVKDRQMSVYFHQGFWQPMDTLLEKNILEDLWKSNNAPWKVW